MKRNLLILIYLFFLCIPFLLNAANSSSIEGSEQDKYIAGAEKLQHFIIYGQSLSSGEQSYPPLSTENVEGNYMIGRQIWINYGHPVVNLGKINPLIANIPSSMVSKDLNYSSMGENPLIGAVNHIQMKTKGTEFETKILATSCGTGATSIEQLSKTTGNLYSNQFLTALYRALDDTDRNKTELSCPAIFWLQGEANSAPNEKGYTNSKDEYKNLMVQLKNDMQSDVISAYKQENKPVFITYQTSGLFLRNFYDLPIAMAQLEASNEYDDIICAGPVYPGTIPTSGAHLNSNGYRWYGEMLAKVYYRTQILKEDFKPLQPVGFYGTENLNEIKIQFHVPYPPLVLDEYLISKKTNFGFEVKINGEKVKLNNVSIADDCVILVLNKNIGQTDIVEISYAGIDIQSGNLRDSDPYTAYYNYEDLDKKDEGGVFIYPRLNNGTLRPRLEPKGTDGKVIYGKPYPLYNFCVAFYKKINAEELQDSSSNILIDHTNDIPSAYMSDSHLYIDIKDELIKNIRIYNLSGFEVKEFKENKNKYLVDFLPDGPYITKISTDVGTYVSKTIKTP